MKLAPPEPEEKSIKATVRSKTLNKAKAEFGVLSAKHISGDSGNIDDGRSGGDSETVVAFAKNRSEADTIRQLSESPTRSISNSPGNKRNQIPNNTLKSVS